MARHDREIYPRLLDLVRGLKVKATKAVQRIALRRVEWIEQEVHLGLWNHGRIGERWDEYRMDDLEVGIGEHRWEEEMARPCPETLVASEGAATPTTVEADPGYTKMMARVYKVPSDWRVYFVVIAEERCAVFREW